METFLVAMDGSEPAERALDWALELASGLGAKIILYRFLPRASSVADFEAEKRDAESYLARLAEAHGNFILTTVIRQPRPMAPVISPSRPPSWEPIWSCWVAAGEEARPLDGFWEAWPKT